MMLGMSGSSVAALVNAQSAGFSLYELIDRVPPIDISSDEGLKPSHYTGNIEFRDVHFTYPSLSSIHFDWFSVPWAWTGFRTGIKFAHHHLVLCCILPVIILLDHPYWLPDLGTWTDIRAAGVLQSWSRSGLEDIPDDIS